MGSARPWRRRHRRRFDEVAERAARLEAQRLLEEQGRALLGDARWEALRAIRGGGLYLVVDDDG